MVLTWAIVVAVLHFYNYSRVILALIDNSTAPSYLHIQLASSYIISSGIKNYRKFWGSVRDQEYGDFLYPRSFDADKVLFALRQSKVIRADLSKQDTTLKFNLTLEGGQPALFKIMLK